MTDEIRADGETAVKTVLYLDDSTCALRLMERFLKDEMQVHCCPTTAEAEAVLKEHAIDCFVLDYNLSDGDGISFAQTLRADRRYTKTPIILLSAAVAPELAHRAMRCGINQCLAKPYPPSEVKAIINAQIANPTIERVERSVIAASCAAWQADDAYYQYSPDTGKLVSARTPEDAHAQMHESLRQWVGQTGKDCETVLEPTFVQHTFALE